MALDQYTSEALLAQTGQITNVDTRQALVASQSLQNRLDQVSEMALGSLEESAIQRGQMYGVKNAPTLEQVTKAIQQDQDVNVLFAEEGTVFGDNARKVQAQLFRQDSYSLFSSQIETISANLDKKGIITLPEVEQISNEIQTNIDATVELLQEVDVAQAVKFNAEANILGNTLFNKLNTKALELELEQKKSQVLLFEESYVNNFVMTLVQEGGNLESAYVKMAPAKQNLFASYGLLPNGLTKQQEIATLDNKAMTQAVGTILSSNPKYYNNFNQTYNSLVTNNPPPELSFFSKLPRETRVDILTKIKKESKDLIAIQKASLDKTNLTDKTEANRLANEYLETKNPEILETLKTLSNKNPNAFNYKDLKSLVENKEAWKLNNEEKYTPSAIRFVESINNGNFATYDEMATAAKENNFSDNLINQYFAKTLESKRIRIEENMIDKAVNTIVSPAAKPQIKAKVKSEIDNEIDNITEQNVIDSKNATKQEVVDQASDKVKKKRVNKKLNSDLELLTTSLISYDLADIQNEIPQDEQGRYIIDTTSPEIITILNRIKDLKGDTAFNNMKSIFQSIENQYKQMDEM